MMLRLNPTLVAARLFVICTVLAPPTAGIAQVQVLGSDEPEAAETPPEVDLPCGTEEFTIAAMAWPSAAILAHVHALLIERTFDCPVRVVPGEPAPTLSSMATTRQPALAPELWISRHAEMWNGAINAQAVRAAGDSFTGGALEAWFVPDYVKADHPGLNAVTDLADHWQAFVPEDEEDARFVSCPPDWACTITNEGLMGALGLDERFALIEPEDRFEMDTAIAEAVARREPVLTYYWQPNALIDQLSLVPLDMGNFDSTAAQCMAIAGCIPFVPSAFAPDTVVIAAADWVFTDAPQLAHYLGRAAMPLAEMNALLAWQAETEAAPQATAERFLATRQEVWRQWIEPDALDQHDGTQAP